MPSVFDFRQKVEGLSFFVSLLTEVRRAKLVQLQCVCVFSSHSFWTSSSLDVPAGVTQEEGHMPRISHPPSFCGACINFSQEKDPAIPFPRRP